MNKSPITKKGEVQLREKLHFLKTTERQRLRFVLEAARALGDLKENAEYHAAKDEQGLIEAKISYIEGQLQTATIIEVSKLPKTGKVVFGTTVTLENIEDDTQVTYQIVGEAETNIDEGKISYQSPIARACIGQPEGEVVAVDTPKGKHEYEIISIDYID